jgi:hypothetical protein
MKVEINIPESLNDITLEQYQRFLSIEQPTNEDLLSCFLNINLEAINKINASKFDEYVVTINGLFEVKQEHELRFVLNGVEFGFIPNLDVISYGENKDITTYVNDWQSMNKAMAVLYRPIKQQQGKKYLIEEYDGTSKYSELMKQMPLGIVMGSMLFFWNLTNELLNCIPSYLEKEMEKQVKTELISAENGEAIRNFTTSLRETLEDLTILQNYPYIRA